MRNIFVYIIPIFFSSISVSGQNLNEIKVKLDSAIYFEDDLKVETALRYFESIEKPIELLLEEKPNSSELWRIDGMVKARTGTLEEAYDSFTTSILLDSEDLESQIEYIKFTVKSAKNLAEDLNQYKSQLWLQYAFDVCAKALENFPFHSKLHELAGDIYATINDIKNCTYHYEMSYKAKQQPETALKLYRLYAVNKDYKNEVKMVGILSKKYRLYAEFYAVQAQLSFESVLSDPTENSRYLPGVKETLMKAVDLGSHNPSTYYNYFELIKMGYSIDAKFKVTKDEVLKVIDKAGTVFNEMSPTLADIFLEGANLLKDLDHDVEACSRYEKVKSIAPSKAESWAGVFCK